MTQSWVQTRPNVAIVLTNCVKRNVAITNEMTAARLILMASTRILSCTHLWVQVQDPNCKSQVR